MRGFRSMLIVLILALGMAGVINATDNVSVESKVVSAGAANVKVKVAIANSDTLRGITLPLEIRSVSGNARPTSLRVEFAERLVDRLDDIQVQSQYDTKDGICGHTGDSTYRYPLTRAVDSTITVTHLPWGLSTGAFRLSSANSMIPGEDSSGSLILHMSLAGDTGIFEIDTVCNYPALHIVYILPAQTLEEPNGVTPTFAKGVITVVGCNCEHHGDLDGDSQITALDLGLLIDHVFGGQPAPPADASCPHIDRGDVDCSGFDDASDITLMVDILYASASACDPCECDPYPTSCP